MLFSGVNPLAVFAVRSLASLEQPATKAEMLRHRSALRVTLEAAGVDMSNLAKKPAAPFADAPPHALLCWYDQTSNVFRLFLLEVDEIDETTGMALDLLNGTMVGRADGHPIEDLDAAIRLMALFGAGGATAEELYENHVAPNLDRWDDEFTAPDADDLEELWCSWRKKYIGGTVNGPDDIEVWIARTYAFGF